MYRLIASGRIAFAAFLWPALLGAAFVLSGCDIVNPPEQQGAYIRFENPQVRIEDGDNFTSDAGIQDIWLYHNGFLIGTFPVLPIVDDNWTVAPYLLDPTNNFFLEGGIHESGLQSVHLPYPFWDRISFDVEQNPGDTFTVTPVFEYVEDSRYNIPVSETFERPVLGMIPFSSSLSNPDSTYFRRRDDDPFRGQRYGHVTFGPDDRFFEVISSEFHKIERGLDTYAEITYRNNVEFTVGLLYRDNITNDIAVERIVTVRAQNSWNTIYVHMVGQIRELTNLFGEDIEFALWLYADGNGQEGFIDFDDIRLLHEE